MMLQMLFQTLAEIEHTDQGIEDGQYDKEDREDGKGRKRLSDRHVILRMERVVDSGQLEDEVRQSSEVKKHDDNHARLDLAPGEEGSEEKDSNGYRDSGSGQTDFDCTLPGDDDEELDGETDEEEEIELQEGDVHLVGNWLSPPLATTVLGLRRLT